MLKAFTPVSVLLISVLFQIEGTTIPEFIIVLVICLGVCLTTIGELKFSLIGFTCQLIGTTAESVRLVLTNVLLRQHKLDPLSSLYYIAPICTISIGICFLYYEHHLFRPPYIDILHLPSTVAILLINGLVAFNLNISVMLLIANTSAMTLTLSGIFKDLLLVGSSIVFFQSSITRLQCIGYALALLGLNLHKEYKRNPAAIGKLFQQFAPQRIASYF